MNKPQDLLDNTEFIIQERVSFSAQAEGGERKGGPGCESTRWKPRLHSEEKGEREEKVKETKPLFYQQVDFAEVQLSSQPIWAGFTQTEFTFSRENQQAENC